MCSTTIVLLSMTLANLAIGTAAITRVDTTRDTQRMNRFMVVCVVRKDGEATAQEGRPSGGRRETSTGVRQSATGMSGREGKRSLTPRSGSHIFALLLI